MYACTYICTYYIVTLQDEVEDDYWDEKDDEYDFDVGEEYSFEDEADAVEAPELISSTTVAEPLPFNKDASTFAHRSIPTLSGPPAAPKVAPASSTKSSDFKQGTNRPPKPPVRTTAKSLQSNQPTSVNGDNATRSSNNINADMSTSFRDNFIDI